MAEVVVIGVGNHDRGDDAVGREVVAELEGEVPARVRLAAASGDDPTTLIALWSGAGAAVVVDAMVSGAEPGTVTRFDAAAAPLPAVVRLASTHSMGAQSAIELSRSLGSLPPSLTVVGVEAGSFALGAGLSVRVAEAVPDAVRAVRELIDGLGA